MVNSNSEASPLNDVESNSLGDEIQQAQCLCFSEVFARTLAQSAIAKRQRREIFRNAIWILPLYVVWRSTTGETAINSSSALTSTGLSDRSRESMNQTTGATPLSVNHTPPTARIQVRV